MLLVSAHPVQYASPVFRQMAQHPKLDIQVAYCSLQGAEPGLDPDFGVEVKWDVPLLEGYPWVKVDNKSPWPGSGRFWGLFNPGLWKLVSAGGYDAVVVFTGYKCASFWITLVAAKLHREAYSIWNRRGRAFPSRWPELEAPAQTVVLAAAVWPGERGDCSFHAGG